MQWATEFRGEDRSQGSTPRRGLGLATVLGLVLLGPLLAAILAALTFHNYLQETEFEASHVQLATLLEARAADLRDHVAMLETGGPEHRTQIDDLMLEIDLGLDLLHEKLEPGSAAISATLVARAHRQWRDLVPEIEALVASPASRNNALSQKARRSRIIGRLRDLQHTGSELISSLVKSSSRSRAKISFWLELFGELMLVLVVAGYLYARTRIVEPVRALTHATRDLARGEVPTAIRAQFSGEVATLAFSFNEMARQIQQLLGAQERQRRRAEALIDDLPLGTIQLDQDLRIRSTNRTLQELFGASPSELQEQPLTSLLQDPDLEAYLHHVAQTGEPFRLPRLEITRPDRAPLVLRVSVSRTRALENETLLLVLLRDLSGEERLRDQARRSEATFRTLLEAIPDAVVVHVGGRFTYLNPAAIRQLGRAGASDLIGTKVLDVLHPDDRELSIQRVTQMFNTGEALLPTELRFLRADRSVLHGEVFDLPFEYQGRPAVLAIVRDLSDRQELASRMREMDRMIAVGTLAAGVGHEINNPLAYVLANLEHTLELVEEMKALEPVAKRSQGEMAELLGEAGEALGDAREGATRVRDIVRDLRTFSATPSEERTVLSLEAVLEQAISLAGNEIRHRATLLRDFMEVPPVQASASHLGQVFVNLLLNAAQAIPMGAASENTITVRLGSEGEQVFVEITDTGSGIPADTVGRIFDPFFTTKEVGKGMGLGLALSQQTVHAHDGELAVHTKLGEGSTFRVTLPAAPSLAADLGDAIESQGTMIPGTPPKQGGRVLVIDDEVMILRSVSRVLKASHDVRTTTRGREALAWIAGGENYDVILCDLMMPDLSGPEFFDALSDAHPELASRTIFLTGGAFTPEAQAFLDASTRPHLSKPFDPRELRSLVQGAVFDSAAA